MVKLNNVKITISGPPGSGTTTTARKVSEVLGIPLISAGDLFRDMARKRGMSVEEFSRYAESDPEVDLLIDKSQRERAEKLGTCVVEGRLSAWMINDANLKILVFADDAIRFQRIAKRERKSVELAKRETLEREAVERERYKKYYGIDIDNWNVYDLVINSSSFTSDEIVEVVLKALELRLRNRYEERN
jgi:cytidylate kinase